jgi:hypothetical protein
MQGETTMSVLSNSWRCSLVATAFWTMLAGVPVGAAADDQPAKTPAAGDREKAEQQLAERQLQSITAKIGQLELEGKHEEAQRLVRQAREMMPKAWSLRDRSMPSRPAVSGPEAEKIRERWRSRDGSTSSQPAPSSPETEKIRGHLKEMGHKIGQLEKEGKHEEAQHLKREAMELYSKLNPPAGAAPAPGGPEREKLRQQWLAVREKLEKAKQEGRPEDVQRLAKEVEAMQARLYPQPGGDREARLQHLRAAAEHLKAAGAELEAQHVMRIVQRMQEERSRDGRREGEAARAEHQRRPPAGTAAPASRPGAGANLREYASAQAVQELQGQVAQIRRELLELRVELNRAKNSERR